MKLFVEITRRPVPWKPTQRVYLPVAGDYASQKAIAAHIRANRTRYAGKVMAYWNRKGTIITVTVPKTGTKLRFVKHDDENT